MKKITLLLAIVLCFNVTTKAQSWFRSSGLDTTATLVNKGFTSTTVINFAYSGTSAVFIKFYDTKTAPNRLVNVPVLTIQLFNTTLVKAFTYVPVNIIKFKNGLYVRATTGITDTSSVIPTVKPIVEIQY